MWSAVLVNQNTPCPSAASEVEASIVLPGIPVTVAQVRGMGAVVVVA